MFASPDVASCRLRPSRADAPTSIYLASCACSEHQTSQTDRSARTRCATLVGWWGTDSTIRRSDYAPDDPTTRRRSPLSPLLLCQSRRDPRRQPKFSSAPRPQCLVPVPRPVCGVPFTVRAASSARPSVCPLCPRSRPPPPAPVRPRPCSRFRPCRLARRFGYAHLAYTVCLRTHGHASRQGSHQGTSHPGRAHPSAPRPRLSSASLTDPPPHRTPASTARLAFPGKHSGIHLYRVRRQASCLPFEPQELASIPSAPCRTQRSASIWIICIFRRGPPRRRTTKESLSLCVSVSCPPFRSTATNLAAKRYHLSPTSVATRQVKRPVCCLRAFQRTRRTPEGLSLLALVSDKDRLPLA